MSINIEEDKNTKRDISETSLGDSSLSEVITEKIIGNPINTDYIFPMLQERGSSPMAAEFTALAEQTIPVNQNVPFTETAIDNSRCIIHRQGSGLVTLSSPNKSCVTAQYKVTGYANIAVPATGTAGPISLALGVNGEALGSTIATVTPTATEAYFNVALGAIICVPGGGCCVQVSLKNASTQDILVKNANFIVERIA